MQFKLLLIYYDPTTCCCNLTYYRFCLSYCHHLAYCRFCSSCCHLLNYCMSCSSLCCYSTYCRSASSCCYPHYYRSCSSLCATQLATSLVQNFVPLILHKSCSNCFYPLSYCKSYWIVVIHCCWPIACSMTCYTPTHRTHTHTHTHTQITNLETWTQATRNLPIQWPTSQTKNLNTKNTGN